ncbi:MAG: AbrB/MazE/SpoVT family DNA-binding domain-containing protein [Lachnospiraceae bacterium]|nr:AbrB/MazE/SpoVT family DNA-binding domain-containing protein [Lachnospiraceae bacterium]
MKDTGVVRKIDELGRFTLPMELRRKMNIEVGDPLEVFVDEESIILRKYIASDIFTGNTEDLIEYQGKKISKKTIFELAQLVGLKMTEQF